MYNVCYLSLVSIIAIKLLPTTSGLILRNMTMFVNPDYGTANYSIYELEGKQYIDSAFELKKELRVRTMIIYRISKIWDGKKVKLLALPKINFCDLTTSVASVPVLSGFMKLAGNSGNFVKKCPYKPGVYYLKQFETQSAAEILFLPRGLYYSFVQLLDENVLKRVNVMKMELYSEQL